MKNTVLITAAALLLTGTAALAQSNAMSNSAPNSSGSAMSSGQDQSGDMSAKPAKKMRMSHHMSKSEAAMNASEADTTRQLNQDQSQYASNGSGTAMPSSAAMPGSNDVRTGSGNAGRAMRGSNSNAAAAGNGMGKVSGANSGVEGRVGGSNSNMPQ